MGKDKTRRPGGPLTERQVRDFLDTLDDYGCADGRWTITPQGVKELCEAWLERHATPPPAAGGMGEPEHAQHAPLTERASFEVTVAGKAVQVVHASTCACIERAKNAALSQIEGLKNQLPAEMQDCTIIFKECGMGHGWLTADNWVQHPCPTCAAESAEREVATERAIVDRIWDMLGRPAYEELKGRSIYDLIAELQQSATRARSEGKAEGLLEAAGVCEGQAPSRSMMVPDSLEHWEASRKRDTLLAAATAIRSLANKLKEGA